VHYTVANGTPRPRDVRTEGSYLTKAFHGFTVMAGLQVYIDS
jgi:hypothetical protein